MTEALLLLVIALQLVQLWVSTRRPAASAPAAPPAPLPPPVLAAPALSPGAQGWSRALQAASASGWSPELPDGPTLDGWCAGVGAEAAARLLVAAIGDASRRGLTANNVDARDLHLRSLFAAAAAWVDGLGAELRLVSEPPGAVGPRHRERWLWDAARAESLGQPPTAGLLKPRIVLRPLLLRGEHVLVEGEVA